MVEGEIVEHPTGRGWCGPRGRRPGPESTVRISEKTDRSFRSNPITLRGGGEASASRPGHPDGTAQRRRLALFTSNHRPAGPCQSPGAGGGLRGVKVQSAGRGPTTEGVERGRECMRRGRAPTQGMLRPRSFRRAARGRKAALRSPAGSGSSASRRRRGATPWRCSPSRPGADS